MAPNTASRIATITVYKSSLKEIHEQFKKNALEVIPQTHIEIKLLHGAGRSLITWCPESENQDKKIQFVTQGGPDYILINLRCEYFETNQECYDLLISLTRGLIATTPKHIFPKP